VEIPNKEISNNIYNYPFCYADRFVHNYGTANKVLYMPHILPVNQPYLYIYIPKSYITDDTTISVSEFETNEYNSASSRLKDIFPCDRLDKPSTWSDSEDYPNFKRKSIEFKDIRLYSSSSYNSTKPTYFKFYFTITNYNGELGNTFTIPFTLVSLRKEVPTKKDLDDVVAIYGSSNYDGTMQNLDMFHFDAIEKNPYLTYCQNCDKLTYDTNIELCSNCDYSSTYTPKSGLPYFGDTLCDFAPIRAKYLACNSLGSSLPYCIVFPSSLGITDYSTVKITYEKIALSPVNGDINWTSESASQEIQPYGYGKDVYYVKLSSSIRDANTPGRDYPCVEDYRVVKYIFTITANVNGKTVTYKDPTLEYICGQAPYRYKNTIVSNRTAIPHMIETYGSEYMTECYVKPDDIKPYPDPSTPSTPSTPSKPKVEPGKTAWLTTCDKREYYGSSISYWGRAEKVLYELGTIAKRTCYYSKPDGKFYIPDSWLSDNTIVKVRLNGKESEQGTIITNGKCTIDISNSAKAWISFIPDSSNGWKTATDYAGFKYIDVNFGPISTDAFIDATNKITHKTGDLKLIICNYNGETGNEFEIPYKIVVCQDDISEKEFNTLKNTYGPSNYDGTMNDLSKFNFEAVANGYVRCPNCHIVSYKKDNDFCDVCGYNRRTPIIDNSCPISSTHANVASNEIANINPVRPSKGQWHYILMETPIDEDLSEDTKVEIKFLEPITSNGKPVDPSKFIRFDTPTTVLYGDSKYYSDFYKTSTEKGHRFKFNLWVATSNESNFNGNDSVAIRIGFTVTTTLPDGTVKVYDETNCKNRLDYTYVFANNDDDDKIIEVFKQLVQKYGYEYPTPVRPNTPSGSSTGGFLYPSSKEFKFEKESINVPAKENTNAVILKAKEFNIAGLNHLVVVGSANWIYNFTNTFKTDVNGDAYLWITFKTAENTGEARTGTVSAILKTGSDSERIIELKVNQISSEDTTTDTSNILLEKPRFNGENNKTTTSSSKESKITLDAFNLTEEDCKKVRVYSNDPWVNISKVTYIKKN
jgi:ribosomal protein L37E